MTYMPSVLRPVRLGLAANSQEFDWLEHSACDVKVIGEANAEAFHEDRGPTGSLEALENYTYALRTCEGCPVRLRCLDVGLQPENLEHGIYGGTLPVERRQMLGKLRTRNAHGQTVPTKDESELIRNAQIVRSRKEATA